MLLVFDTAKIQIFTYSAKFIYRKKPSLSHPPPNKSHKPLNIPFHTRLLQCRHVLFPTLHRNHHPRVACRHQLAVHQEAKVQFCPYFILLLSPTPQTVPPFENRCNSFPFLLSLSLILRHCVMQA